MQMVDLRNKSYGQFLVKIENRAIIKKIIKVKFFGLLNEVYKHSMSSQKSIITFILQGKISKFELSYEKKFR